MIVSCGGPSACADDGSLFYSRLRYEGQLYRAPYQLKYTPDSSRLAYLLLSPHPTRERDMLLLFILLLWFA